MVWTNFITNKKRWKTSVCLMDITPWDGRTGGNGWTYDNPKGLFTDADNNIYYRGADGLPWLWCSAERLPYHLHHLQQIKARPCTL